MCLGCQLVHVGHAVRFSAVVHFDGRLLALVTTMADDGGLGTHERNGEALLARALSQTAVQSTCAAENIARGGPSLCADDVDLGPVREKGGGNGLFVGLCPLGGGLEEAAGG